jgi:hypothetical protein
MKQRPCFDTQEQFSDFYDLWCLYTEFCTVKLCPHLYYPNFALAVLTTVYTKTHSSVYGNFSKDTYVFPWTSFYSLLLGRTGQIIGRQFYARYVVGYTVLWQSRIWSQRCLNTTKCHHYVIVAIIFGHSKSGKPPATIQGVTKRNGHLIGLYRGGICHTSSERYLRRYNQTYLGPIA